MKKEAMIKVLRYKAEHIKTKIKPEFFAEVADMLEQEPCEDAISRADAVKVASGYCHPANIAEELAKLSPVTPTQRWIPVTERLPEEGQRVFVTQIVRDRTVVYCTTFPFVKIKEEYITAWMPLPKPYVGESE